MQVVANNGQEALDAIQKQGSSGRPYDVVLMDLEMPGVCCFSILT